MFCNISKILLLILYSQFGILSVILSWKFITLLLIKKDKSISEYIYVYNMTWVNLKVQNSDANLIVQFYSN